MENYVIPQGYKMLLSLDLHRIYKGKKKTEPNLLWDPQKGTGILPLSSVR